jgi:Tol biopolymer transport system component
MRLHRAPSATAITVLWASLILSCAGDDPPGPSEPVASVTVTPPVSMIAPGEVAQLEATPKDASGAELTGRTITWSSDDGDVAVVSPAGVVTAVTPGSATITATSEGRSGTAAITVAILGEACPEAGAPDDRCARVAGTVRDAAGAPVAGASVGAIPADGVAFITGDPVETDANGHYELEVHIAVSDEAPAPVDTFAAYVRATLDLAAEAAVDTSELVPMVFVAHGTRPPVVTTDLVLDRTQPVPAPATRIVFVRDPDFRTADLYVMNADGSDRRPLLVDPTTDFDPSWTPDGQSVLFADIPADYGDPGVRIRLSLMDAAGGNLRPFGDDLTGTTARFSPDGKRVAFLESYIGEGGALRHEAGLWIANADGSEPYRLPTQDDQRCDIPYCSTIAGEPSWYPDGDRIGYNVVLAGGAGAQSSEFFTTRLSDSTSAPIVGPFPIWAADGNRFLTLDFNRIRILTADGTPLAVIPVGSSSITMPEAAWSRDGEWIAYVFQELPSGRYQLWIADRDGNRRRRIALDARDPDWEPASAGPS